MLALPTKSLAEYRRAGEGSVTVKTRIAFIAMFFLVLPSARLAAQWRNLYHLTTGDPFSIVYFFDFDGPPKTGFFSKAKGSVITKTTDGGYTWRDIPIPDQGVIDVAFMDADTGWFATNDGVLKTTDGGGSWTRVYDTRNTVVTPQGIFYNKKSNGLFLAISNGDDYVYASWNHGDTWFQASNTECGFSGIAFNNDDSGVVATRELPWIRTVNGGHTWYSTNMDSATWQPFGLAGTSIQFAEKQSLDGSIGQPTEIVRSDDYWNSWRTVFLDASWPVGCVRGDSQHIFAGSSKGVFMSSDTGATWKYLCGPASNTTATWAETMIRFYAKSPYIYFQTFGFYDQGASLWMLNMDSMQYFDSKVRLSTSSPATAGSKIEVQVASDTNSFIGIDSVHLVLHYEDAFGLNGISLPAGWWVMDSSSNGNRLDLWIGRDGLPLPDELLSLGFSTALSTSSAKIYLDSAHFYGKRLNCDCAAIATAGPDSVTINFSGCGDSTLVEFMRTGSLVRIDRIVPNPARDEVRVSGVGFGAADVEIYDVMGREIRVPWSGVRGPGETTPQPPPISLRSQEGEISLDVRGLPEGMYYLRIGTATKRFVVER